MEARLSSPFQLRKAARERRQLVYQRSLEQQERTTYIRKQAIKDALASGAPALLRPLLSLQPPADIPQL
jgi:hypothetical protein